MVETHTAPVGIRLRSYLEPALQADDRRREITLAIENYGAFATK
jgi:hypothetical protein